MPRTLAIIRHIRLLMILPGLSLAIGLFIPYFYKLVESDRIPKRERQLQVAAIAVALITLTLAVVQAALSKDKESDEASIDAAELTVHDKSTKSRFSLRRIFATTLIAAIFLALATGSRQYVDSYAATSLFLGIGVAIVVSNLILSRSEFHNFVAVTAAMFLPFVWVIRFNKPFGSVSGMLGLLVLGPGLIPTKFIARLADPTGANTGSLSALVVLSGLALGWHFSRRGRKPAIAYTIFALLLSTFTSMIIHALYRA